MSHWIEHIYEPSKLVLAWQAPDRRGNRKRFAVGEILRHGSDFMLRYYRGNDDVADARALGYQGYAAFDIKQHEHSKGVLDAFMRRLPPRSRPDFSEYLAAFRLPSGSVLSDFSLLGYSEAKLPSDGFSLVNTLDEILAPAELMLEIAGYRHYEPYLTSADIGGSVELVHEPANPYDPGALSVRHGQRTIGYINRLQAPAVLRLLRSHAVSAVIERLNGRADWPRAFIFLWVKSTNGPAPR